MKNELVREIKISEQSIARVTIESYTEKRYMDGIEMGEDVVIAKPVIEIVKEGKVILNSDYITTTNYKGQECTRIGDSLLPDVEIYNNIKAAINEMEEEIKEVESIETEEVNEEIEEAKAVVAQVEKEGIENLMTVEEIKVWRKRYNDLHNEGGEGYIPNKISKEQYNKAIEVIKDRRKQNGRIN